MHRFVVIASLALLGCGPSGSGSDNDAGSGPCVDGQRQCSDTELQNCVGGQWQRVEECANACDPNLGCVQCEPGTGTCEGNVATTCKADGSGYESNSCDSDMGLTCNAGQCVGACSEQSLGNSYIGCEYFPTVTPQLVNPSFPFAIVVSNTSAQVARVTISGGALQSPTQVDVPAQSVHVQELPWVSQLKMCNLQGFQECPANAIDPNEVQQVPSGSYHLKSTQPVTVYQFSPKDYRSGSSFSFSNDASLLLPVNALQEEYRVVAYPYWQQADFFGFMSITATKDDTEVQITPTAPSAGTPSLPVGTATSVTLQEGEVLQVPNTSGDLTGSQIVSDKPVQVIGGHYCTNIPQDVIACDHLEESLFPVETLSTNYIVSAPAVPTLPNGRQRIIRIVATEANTNLSYDPPLPGAAANIANAGAMIEVAGQDGDFQITADKKIIVAEFMVGQAIDGNAGDPAMALAVASDQYREEYLFHAPTNYVSNYVNLTAPTGANVTIDGTAVSNWTAVGSSGFQVARVRLDNGPGNDGTHTANGDMPFGITVYGYGDYTSYWYPGGLNLDTIVVE